MAQLLSNLPIGAKVKDLGTTYHGKPIVFLVTGKNHPGYPANAVTLLTERIISVKAFDAKEPSNSDTNRRNYGNNRYLHSNIRQWLNKDTQPWYSAQHGADAQPDTAGVSYNPYNTERGFLANFSAHFKNRLLTTTLTVARNVVTDGEGSETVQDKVFLLSNTEVGLANENNIAEGSRLALFTTADSSRLANPTPEAVANSNYTNSSFNASQPWYWWLRTPYAGYSVKVRHVSTSGVISSHSANYGNYGVRPALNLPSDIRVSDNPDSDGAYVITWNAIPSLSLITPDSAILYEKDVYQVAGQAQDGDAGQIVNVRYQINGGTARAIATAISDGTTPIAFNRQLTFRGGILYDGTTAVTSKLAEGIAHTLSVWAEDDQGGKSEIETRTFYVVPNRPPSLTIDPIDLTSGLIEADKITITGTSFDADDNDVIVRYRINNGINVEIHNGPAGEFSFDIPVSKLIDGENSIVVEVTDTYDFKASKTIKLNKSANLTPLSHSVQRYTIVPPAGSAQGVLLWIKRDEAQDVSIEISMTNGTEPENFVPMVFDSSGPDEIGTVEDFYKYRADVPAEKIAIKISWTGDKPIHQIQGALTQ